jgi:hypothetical protein
MIGAHTLRKSLAWPAAWVGLTLILAVSKYPVLGNPPYNEYAETLWTEATFLAETGFDLPRLFREPQIEEGGVRAYSHTLPPIFIAALLRTVGPTPTFVLYRLLTLGMAAAVMLWTVAVIARRFGFPRAVLVSAAVYTFAFFVAGLEMLSLEFPLSIMIVAAVAAFSRRHFVLAAALALLAFGMKATALPPTASLLVCLVAWLWSTPHAPRAETMKTRIGIVALAVVLFLQWRILAYAARDAQVGYRNLLIAPIVLPRMVFYLSPYLVPVVAMLVLGEGGWWTRWVLRNRGQILSRARRLVRVACHRQPELLVAAVYVTAIFASFSVAMYLPRYLISVAPFLAILLADLFYRRLDHRLGYAVLGLILFYNAFNVHGWWMPSIPNSFLGPSSWISMERSLEYRQDLQSTRQLCQFLASSPQHEPILAGKLMTHLLSSRYFGYVNQPLAGYTVLDNFHLGRLRPALRILDDQPGTLLVISIPQGDYYLPDVQTSSIAGELVWSDTLRPPLTVTRYRFASTATAADYQEFYRDIVRRNVDPYIRCSMLASCGYDDLGLAVLKRRFRQTSEPTRLMRWLADELESLDSPLSAQAIREVLREKDKNTSADHRKQIPPGSPRPSLED